MKIKYFEDSDTALIEFNQEAVAETKEISENLYVDLDAAGNVVSMTIEHAGETAGMPEIALERFDEPGVERSAGG